MFGPSNIPSLVTSVTTYRGQPACSSLSRTSNRSPPSSVQPRAANLVPRTSSPTAILSPYLAITSAVQSGFSSAAVPRFTLSAPADRAASNEGVSLMPPLSSIFTFLLFATTSRMIALFSPLENAASRSTRCIHSAPASIKTFAASIGEP